VIGVALNLRRAAILYRDQNSASIGAIVRTRGMDDLFRHRSIIECFFQDAEGVEVKEYGRLSPPVVGRSAAV
jgi:hypothetical protein